MAGPGPTPASRIRERLGSTRLSPVQRLILEYVTERIDEIVLLSSADLAAAAGVSQASVSRFCRALDFDDYAGFQRWLHQVATERSNGEIEQRSDRQRLVLREGDGLRELALWLADESPLQAAATAMMASPCIPIVGTRASAPLAGYVGYFARRIHPDVRVIVAADSAGRDEVVQARLAGAAAALVVWVPRFDPEVGELIEELAASGLRIWLITDPSLAPPVPTAVEVLPVSITLGSLFDSHAAVVAMGATLVEAMAHEAPNAVGRRLSALEGGAPRRRRAGTPRQP